MHIIVVFKLNARGHFWSVLKRLQLKVHFSFVLWCIRPSGILDIEELQLQLWVSARSAL